MPPTPTNGKICYIEIPALDIKRSADFYAKVFGWKIRKRGDGATAFDDAAGQVSGTWLPGRPAASQPGLLVYIMVDSVAATIEAVTAQGGTLVQPIGRRRARDHRAIPGPWRKRDRPVPGARALGRAMRNADLGNGELRDPRRHSADVFDALALRSAVRSPNSAFP